MMKVSKTGWVCSALLMLVAACHFCGLTPVATAQQTIFTAQTPALPNVHVGPYELGTEFTSSVSGKILAIRFWKSSSETGQHVGHIWSTSGQLLASATFTSETASGWQQQSLSTPLTIAANTGYIVSVNSGTNAYYAATTSGLTSQVVNQHLSTVLGNNGVFGPPGQFPTNSYKQSNYFRDVVFSADLTLLTTQTPALPNVNVGPYELGTEFTSSASGQILAIRFWKSSSETGQHVGHIWSPSGQLLASVTFASETSSGWQQQSLPTPLTIAANSAYVVSVNSGTNAYYAATTSGLTTQVINQTLSTVLGNNGVFGPPGQFPTNSYKQSNYFRDIVFAAGSGSGPGGISGPQISVLPQSISFSSVAVGITNTQTVTVSNPGGANLSVSQATVSGSGFALKGISLPLTVAPGSSASFTVSFSPTASGNATGSLTLVSNAPTSPTTVALSGSGTTASVQLTASPSSLSFGNVIVGSTSSKTVTLTNSGNSSLSISQLSASGSGFTASGLTVPLSLSPGQSTTLNVNFDPTAAGSVTGSVSVASNATNSPTQIALTGSGLHPSTSTGPLAAFPGAQGGGSLSAGGRGGVVYEVTNLNDSGTGSLRNCVNASGPRTCVFLTGGTIVLSSTLHITNPFITIAGQTAPGGGIQITNSSTCNVSSNCDLLRVGTHDVTIQYVRARMSAESGTNYSSPFSALNENANVYNVTFDHCSAAWGEWDNWDIYMGSFNSNYAYNLTLQYSLLAEPRYDTNGGVNVQVSGNSSAISNNMTDIDFHHNFLTGGNHRNPIHRAQSGRLVSNLIYNPQYYAMKGGGNKDFINNYIKAGPYGGPVTAIQGWTAVSIGTTAPLSLYIAGNAADSNGFNGGSNQWTGTLAGLAPGEDNSDSVTTPLSTQYQRTNPLALSPSGAAAITADSATSVASSTGVLLPAYPNSANAPGVGASVKLNDSACDGSYVTNRDALDSGYVSQFLNGSGHSGNITAPGSLPFLPAGSPCSSSLHDGIADQWKINHGLSTSDATVYKTLAPNGYTYLENYLNGTDPNVLY